MLLKPRIHECAKWFANCSRTKCVYVWTELWTCAAPSTNGKHTVRPELKFVNFLREHKENWMHRVSFPCAGYPKLINGVPKMRCLRAAQCVSGALVYTKLYLPRTSRCPYLYPLLYYFYISFWKNLWRIVGKICNYWYRYIFIDTQIPIPEKSIHTFPHYCEICPQEADTLNMLHSLFGIFFQKKNDAIFGSANPLEIFKLFRGRNPASRGRNRVI